MNESKWYSDVYEKKKMGSKIVGLWCSIECLLCGVCTPSFWEEKDMCTPPDTNTFAHSAYWEGKVEKHTDKQAVTYKLYIHFAFYLRNENWHYWISQQKKSENRASNTTNERGKTQQQQQHQQSFCKKRSKILFPCEKPKFDVNKHLSLLSPVSHCACILVVMCLFGAHARTHLQQTREQHPHTHAHTYNTNSHCQSVWHEAKIRKVQLGSKSKRKTIK